MNPANLANIAELATVFLSGVMLAACGESARLTVAEGSGPQPRWVSPNPTMIPTVNIAPFTRLLRGFVMGLVMQRAA